MGLGITIICALAIVFLVVVARQLVVYVFLFLFVFFEELGTGFTSFAGSFVYNQDFVNFSNFRFIEILIAAAYMTTLLTYRNKRPPFMAAEKRLGILFVLLIITLLCIEFFLHNAITVSDWRLIVSGILLLHLMAMLVNSEKKLLDLVKVFLVFLTARALIGLAAYAVGHGVMSPRGMVPFFWDSRQVDAFAYGSILLTAYLANFRSLKPSQRLFPRMLAMAMLAILCITVLLSIRRTVWIVALLGILAVLFISKRIKLPQYVGIGFLGATGLIFILVLPVFQGFWEHMDTYFSSINLLNKKVASSYENEVHTDNVKQYTKMILDNPSVLALGYRGYPGPNYSNLPKLYSKKFPLGVAHNGILRTIYFYGIAGLILYFAFYMRIFLMYKKLSRMPEHSLMKHVGLASLILLFLEFSSTLTLVPPFYTTSKGLFYTFLAVFVVRAAYCYRDSAVEPATLATAEKPVIKKTANARSTA